MKRTILAMLVIIITACQTAQVKYYEVPAEFQEGEVATIVGTKVDPKSWLLADEITYVLGVDGDPVEGGKKRYDTPVHIIPGEHAVQIANIQGDLTASTSFSLDIKGSESLVARTEILDTRSVRIWIEEENGGKVTDVVVAPRSAGGTLFIPIFF